MRRGSTMRVVPVMLLLGLVLASCGGDDRPAVEFGEGTIPASVPADVPIPPGTAIGSTLIDRTNDRTEVTMRINGPLIDVVQFYTVELVNSGYVVDRSESGAASWTIEFSRGTLRGSVVMQAQASGAFTQAILDVNRS